MSYILLEYVKLLVPIQYIVVLIKITTFQLNINFMYNPMSIFHRQNGVKYCTYKITNFYVRINLRYMHIVSIFFFSY